MSVCGITIRHAPVAQLVEHETFNLVVAGSIPAGRTDTIGRNGSGIPVSHQSTWPGFLYRLVSLRTPQCPGTLGGAGNNPKYESREASSTVEIAMNSPARFPYIPGSRSRWPACYKSQKPTKATAIRFCSTAPRPRSATTSRWGSSAATGPARARCCAILLGEEELDSGEVVRHPSLRLGYLRQHDPFLPGETALEFLMRDSGQPDWKCGEVAGQFELKGAYLDGPDRQALRRLADAREAGGPAAARAEPAAARRADELPRPAHADSARTLPARASGRRA